MTYNPNFKGSYAIAPASGIANVLDNKTGSDIGALTPVYSNTSGEMAPIDISSDTQSLALLGITTTNVPDSNSGTVISGGKLSNVSIGSFGDTLYVSKTGGLTNAKPSEGVAGFASGDWIIRIGVIIKNQDNPANKDLLLQIDIVGQI